jgi:hypothetical protein
MVSPTIQAFDASAKLHPLFEPLYTAFAFVPLSSFLSNSFYSLLDLLALLPLSHFRCKISVIIQSRIAKNKLTIQAKVRAHQGNICSSYSHSP